MAGRPRGPIPVPSRWWSWWARIGVGDYREVGREFLGYFVELGGLRPADVVLDAGCGTGRMAAALATHLKPPGRYEGFDVSASSIWWCRRHISSRHPAFRFRTVPVRNSLYRRRGSVTPEQFVFPYADEEFTFAVATSLFTHMLPAGMTRYFAECARWSGRPDGVSYQDIVVAQRPPGRR